MQQWTEFECLGRNDIRILMAALWRTGEEARRAERGADSARWKLGSSSELRAKCQLVPNKNETNLFWSKFRTLYCYVKQCLYLQLLFRRFMQLCV